MSVIASARNSGVFAGRELTVTHYFQVHEFAESSQFSNNATCLEHETTDNRLPSLTTRASDYTVTMTKRYLDKCYNIVRTNEQVYMAGRVHLEWSEKTNGEGLGYSEIVGRVPFKQSYTDYRVGPQRTSLDCKTVYQCDQLRH